MASSRSSLRSLPGARHPWGSPLSSPYYVRMPFLEQAVSEPPTRCVGPPQHPRRVLPRDQRHRDHPTVPPGGGRWPYHPADKSIDFATTSWTRPIRVLYSLINGELARSPLELRPAGQGGRRRAMMAVERQILEMNARLIDIVQMYQRAGKTAASRAAMRRDQPGGPVVCGRGPARRGWPGRASPAARSPNSSGCDMGARPGAASLPRCRITSGATRGRISPRPGPGRPRRAGCRDEHTGLR